MSRFIDPAATVPVDMGECQCPGKPHTKDVANIRKEYSGRDRSNMRSVASQAILSSTDENAGTADAIAPFVVSWNLMGPDGQPMRPSRQAIGLLDEDSLMALILGISAQVAGSEQAPNPSGAPSVASPQESASPTPA